MTDITPAQLLKPAKLALGRPIQLTPYQSVLRVDVTDTDVRVVLHVMKYTETAREVRFTKSGIRLRSWKLNGKLWKENEPFTIWDDDFVPYTEARFGRHISVDEYTEQRRWEAETYRCGSGRTPMDSFNRTVEGGRETTTDKMFKYWTGHDRDLPFTTRS